MQKFVLWLTSPTFHLSGPIPYILSTEDARDILGTVKRWRSQAHSDVWQQWQRPCGQQVIQGFVGSGAWRVLLLRLPPESQAGGVSAGSPSLSHQSCHLHSSQHGANPRSPSLDPGGQGGTKTVAKTSHRTHPQGCDGGRIPKPALLIF